ARKLLPFIPDNAGVLIVPCCRGGSAFTAGSEGTYSERHGASHDACRWGTDTPLYQDLVSRTRAALVKNPQNKFLGVCWMQGEFDLMTSDYASHPQHFNHMVEAFRRDLKQYHSQLNNITDAP
ncbi:sialate O-acetylesterase, partial [Escherichia coli]